VHVAYLIVTFNGSYAKVGCVDDATPAQGDKPVCTAMHWILYIGINLLYPLVGYRYVFLKAEQQGLGSISVASQLWLQTSWCCYGKSD